jgi:endonuclease/exonuclease/phosphatase family metal-dependent hydrolase
MIKVMTFNIRYGLADDRENCWDNRKDLAISRIHAFDPDLLGLQECRDDAQAEFVKAHLPEYEFYGVRREGGGATDLEMAPVLFRKDRFQLIDQGCFWLSESPQVAGSKHWDSVFARTATWVELIDQQSGKTLEFLNTHFDYQPIAIDESARLLRRRVSETIQQHPVIVTGDFNADKASAAYRQLAVTGLLSDASRVVHPGGDDEATFHGFGQPDQLTAIDWILVSDHFQVIDAAIDHTRAGNLFPSDHYPITAVLNWRDRN